MALLSRPGVLVAAAGAAALLALPLPAAAAERDVPRIGPISPHADVERAHDVVLREEARAMRAAHHSSRARLYSTADGYRVEVEVSGRYPDDPQADQQLVDFLGSRVHGPELAGLRVYVGPPREIVRLCGGDPRTLACYAIAEARMYVPGEAVDGIPVEYPLTHEYGHHVAGWRSNNPWDALDWGAKHWASATRVCAHVRSGRLFPGDQGTHYFDDPGEGFADGYAHLHYPELPWHYNELMRPDRSAFAAIRRDVLSPWTGPRSRTFRGRLGPRHGARSFKIRLALDGDLTLRLDAAPSAAYTVEAESAGFGAGRRALEPGSVYGIEWCRRRPREYVTITVRRGPSRQRGRFALTVTWPG